MKITVENGLKRVLIANIVAIVSAVITLVWTLAVLTTQMADISSKQVELMRNQRQISRDLTAFGQLVQDLQRSHDASDAAITRLEGFHFRSRDDGGS